MPSRIIDPVETERRTHVFDHCATVASIPFEPMQLFHTIMGMSVYDPETDEYVGKVIYANMSRYILRITCELRKGVRVEGRHFVVDAAIRLDKNGNIRVRVPLQISLKETHEGTAGGRTYTVM